MTIQNLISSGMDPKTENNPYLGFIYTSFQVGGWGVMFCRWVGGWSIVAWENNPPGLHRLLRVYPFTP